VTHPALQIGEPHVGGDGRRRAEEDAPPRRGEAVSILLQRGIAQPLAEAEERRLGGFDRRVAAPAARVEGGQRPPLRDAPCAVDAARDYGVAADGVTRQISPSSVAT
jgi:hypothetical protein